MLTELFQPPPHTGRVSTGLLILRVILGLAFIQYGLQKLHAPASWAGTAQPVWIQLYACFGELIGGVLLVLGAMTPLGAALIVVDMIGAMLASVIPRGGAHWISSTPGVVTVEKNIIYGIVALVLLFTGPGRFSIDALLTRNARATPLLPMRR